MEYTEAIKAGKRRYFAIEVRDAKYRFYGDVVLENAIWEVTYGEERSAFQPPREIAEIMPAPDWTIHGASSLPGAIQFLANHHPIKERSTEMRSNLQWT